MRREINLATGEVTEHEDAPGIADPIPDRVSSRQFKMQLELSGLSAAVEAWVAGQSKLVQIAYRESQAFEREDPMLQSGFAALAVGPKQVDEFYLAASKL